MTNHLNITSNQPIRRYTQTPFMEISGDCGIYIIEYSKIIFKVRIYFLNLIFS